MQVQSPVIVLNETLTAILQAILHIFNYDM